MDYGGEYQDKRKSWALKADDDAENTKCLGDIERHKVQVAPNQESRIFSGRDPERRTQFKSNVCGIFAWSIESPRYTTNEGNVTPRTAHKPWLYCEMSSAGGDWSLALTFHFGVLWFVLDGGNLTLDLPARSCTKVDKTVDVKAKSHDLRRLHSVKNIKDIRKEPAQELVDVKYRGEVVVGHGPESRQSVAVPRSQTGSKIDHVLVPHVSRFTYHATLTARGLSSRMPQTVFVAKDHIWGTLDAELRTGFMRRATFWIINNYVSGFKRQFSLSDLSLRAPLISCGIPFAIQSLVNYLTVRSWWDFHHSTLGLLLSLSMTGSVTQLFKVTVGRPRLDLIARCQPALGSEDPLWGLSTVDICTQTVSYMLEDGWKSFPSGHSSSLGFLAFYLADKLHLFDNRGHAARISITPLAVAAFVAISRTMDYRHHWHDVLTGAPLALILAYFSYRQYYPDLASVDAHEPYATRFEETETGTGIGGTEITDTLLSYYEGDDEGISTRRNPKTGIRR
ncbi:acid phosphatase/Vanadium-dependent haloperoxidase [Rhizopogon salebrosus TDB-379]|nr:acid phosphatase/Vanadium-dependent haloperoxidase [Rhizopogon salebrosus TDB-379]